MTVGSTATGGDRLVNAAVSDPTLASLSLDGTASSGRVSTTTTVALLAPTGPHGGPGDLASTGSRTSWELVLSISGLLLILGTIGVILAARRRRRRLS